MAAVSISPLPYSLSSMSSRRVPLSSNPNAANSPYRAAAASKQKRSYATIQREESYGQPPPAKKQMLDTHHILRTPTRLQSTQSSAEGKVFTRKSNSSQQSAFERKLVAARERERTVQQTIVKADKTSEENLESIRAWQKHTKRQFPKFVFYFESGSEDARHKCTKQVIALGAVSILNVYLCILPQC
jgi:regulatory subunit for Cdc7p protein kinase